MNSEAVSKIADGLNDAQKQAVLNPLESCTKIVAGAGTGKTKIISKRFSKLVFDLLEQGIENPANRILVITFTDKAANEMKGRIIQELKDNGINVSNSQDLWISTFHSFCIRILKKYSIEAGLSPSFKIGDELELQKIYEHLVKRIKYGEVSTIENAQEVLASVGLGFDILSIDSLKTLSKITDIESLFGDILGVIKKIKSLGLSPIEFLQKSEKSIKEFSNCIQNTPFKFETKEDYANSWAEHYKNYTDDCFVFDTDVFDLLAKTKLILDKFGKRKACEYGMAQGFPENIYPINDIEIFVNKVIAAIYALYQAELVKCDLVDFDDLINKSIEIFKTNNNVRNHYQQYFKQIIVDEFQDTNGAQLELIELLLNPQNPDLTFVGDRKQSIYAFRYAQMENLDVLQQNVEANYGKKYEPISLSINYRSTPEVLNAVNHVTTNELNLENESLSANPSLTYADTSKDIKVTVIDDFENAYDLKLKESEYIAKEIEDLIKRDNAKFSDFAVLVKSHNQADIVEKELKKRNIPSVKKVNTGFFEHPVVKNIYATFRLIKNLEDEQALFRLLKVLLSDSEIFELKKNIDKKLLETMSFEEVKKLNFVQKYKILSISGVVFNSVIAKILDTISFVKQNQTSMTLLQIFEKIQGEIKLFAPIKTTKEFELQEIQNNIKIIEKIIDDYSQNENRINVSNLLDYLMQIKEDKNFELPTVGLQDVNAVQILTIHASKGLEFPYVFVLSIANSGRSGDNPALSFDMQYGKKPGFGLMISKYNGKVNPKSIIYKELWQKPRVANEALRLFYVAVSRAKKYLNVLSFEPYASVKPVEYVENLAMFLNSR